MLPRYSCWCCLVHERVYCHLNWQNDQHAIHEIVRQAHMQLIQANYIVYMYNRCTVVEITLKTTNEVEFDWMKMSRRPVDRTNYRTSEAKRKRN